MLLIILLIIFTFYLLSFYLLQQRIVMSNLFFFAFLIKILIDNVNLCLDFILLLGWIFFIRVLWLMMKNIMYCKVKSRRMITVLVLIILSIFLIFVIREHPIIHDHLYQLYPNSILYLQIVTNLLKELICGLMFVINLIKLFLWTWNNILKSILIV